MPAPQPPKPNNTAAEATPKAVQGAAIAGNLVACVLVGMLLGWGFDWLFQTKPWGLIGGLVVGFMAWLRELWGLIRPPS